MRCCDYRLFKLHELDDFSSVSLVSFRLSPVTAGGPLLNMYCDDIGFVNLPFKLYGTLCTVSVKCPGRLLIRCLGASVIEPLAGLVIETLAGLVIKSLGIFLRISNGDRTVAEYGVLVLTLSSDTSRVGLMASTT